MNLIRIQSFSLKLRIKEKTETKFQSFEFNHLKRDSHSMGPCGSFLFREGEVIF